MKRENEAAKKFEVRLKEGVKAMEILRKCSITEIGEILGVTPERIEGCRVVASGAIEVTCKDEKARNEAVAMAKANKERVEWVRAKERWTGIVIEGISKSYDEGDGTKLIKLAEEIERENGVKLATPLSGWYPSTGNSHRRPSSRW